MERLNVSTEEMNIDDSSSEQPNTTIVQRQQTPSLRSRSGSGSGSDSSLASSAASDSKIVGIKPSSSSGSLNDETQSNIALDGNPNDDASTCYDSPAVTWSDVLTPQTSRPNSPFKDNFPTPSNSPETLPIDNSAFTWAFFNCPATYKIAGLLLLVGGLFTLAIGAVAMSIPTAITGGVLTGIGIILGAFGYFKTPELNNRNITNDLTESIKSN